MARTSREIKRRMASISSTQQITRAMEMVAAAKLRKVQDKVADTRPYYERITNSLAVVLQAVEQTGEELPEIAQRRSGDRHCLLILSSDRGAGRRLQCRDHEAGRGLHKGASPDGAGDRGPQGQRLFPPQEQDLTG